MEQKEQTHTEERLTYGWLEKQGWERSESGGSYFKNGMMLWIWDSWTLQAPVKSASERPVTIAENIKTVEQLERVLQNYVEQRSASLSHTKQGEESSGAVQRLIKAAEMPIYLDQNDLVPNMVISGIDGLKDAIKTLSATPSLVNQQRIGEKSFQFSPPFSNDDVKQLLYAIMGAATLKEAGVLQRIWDYANEAFNILNKMSVGQASQQGSKALDDVARLNYETKINHLDEEIISLRDQLKKSEGSKAPVWVRADNPPSLELNLPPFGVTVKIRYNNREDNEKGKRNLVKELFENGWHDLEWLDETGVAQQGEAGSEAMHILLFLQSCTASVIRGIWSLETDDSKGKDLGLIQVYQLFQEHKNKQNG